LVLLLQNTRQNKKLLTLTLGSFLANFTLFCA
jgi:hypothetical protein